MTTARKTEIEFRRVNWICGLGQSGFADRNNRRRGRVVACRFEAARGHEEKDRGNLSFVASVEINRGEGQKSGSRVRKAFCHSFSLSIRTLAGARTKMKSVVVQTCPFWDVWNSYHENRPILPHAASRACPLELTALYKGVKRKGLS
jgi:hypothetical protein